MATSFKAQALAAELKDRLKVRANLAGLDLAESFAADSNPLIQVGDSLATGDEGALIKVLPVDWPLAQDILGNSAFMYTPHRIQVLVEAAPAGGLSSAQKLDLIAQVAAMGCKVELYESDSGDGVVLADLGDEDKLVGSYEADAWYPMISSQ